MSELLMDHLKRVTDLCEAKTARITDLEAQNKKLVKALWHMTTEFRYDDHNLAFPNCNCLSHQNYKSAVSLLSEVTK